MRTAVTLDAHIRLRAEELGVWTSTHEQGKTQLISQQHAEVDLQCLAASGKAWPEEGNLLKASVPLPRLRATRAVGWLPPAATQERREPDPEAARAPTGLSSIIRHFTAYFGL